jgi:hypothetical protein
MWGLVRLGQASSPSGGLCLLFRDQKSKVLAQEIGFLGEAQVCRDCVYGLNVSTYLASWIEVRNEPLVGLSPMAYCDPRHYWLQDQEGRLECHLAESMN